MQQQMIWSPQQDKALKLVSEWLKSKPKGVFRLFGVAGTGKTEIAKEIASAIDGTVVFCAPTGKAAQVMRERGCANARTVHSLIYHPKEKSKEKLKLLEARILAEKDAAIREKLRAMILEERKAIAQPSFTLNTDSEIRGATLGIVDESSMVDARVGQDLVGFGTPIIALGDPEQLPPVKGEAFFTGAKPDIMLTEIHRQARDNPVIDLATRVRLGEQIVVGQYGESAVVSSPPDPEAVLAHNQLLCGRNATRRAWNLRARQLLGYSAPYPMAGERLVCLKNNHEEGLLNGTIWECVSVIDIDDDEVTLSLRPEEGGEEVKTVVNRKPFVGEEVGIHEWKESNLFDYGYMLTVHKSQGSQWDSVLINDESFVFRNEAKRWLYTGITRACNRVTVVRNK